MNKAYIQRLEEHLSRQFNIGSFRTDKSEASELNNHRLKIVQEMALEARNGSWNVAERANNRLNAMGRTLEVPAVDVEGLKRNDTRRILASARDFSVNYPRC
jgi:hypothetical protein